jgi:hypothetical protein
VRFQPPGVDPRARVPRLTAPVELPAELTQNHVYVQAKVNGLTSFSEDSRGVAANESVQAYLGSGLMKQLTVWFDYSRRQMWVRKDPHFGEPFDHDASGLVLESPDDAFRRVVIRNVLGGSPAAEAGLALDDEVVSVDGDPVAGLTLDAIRARLRRAGQRVRLEIPWRCDADPDDRARAARADLSGPRAR